MSTAIAIRQQEISRWEDAEMVKTLKDTVCKGASDSQLRMFVEICKSTGLNPLLREIWFVPSVGIIAARDGYLRVANENPNFDGIETRVERDAKNIPIKAVCTVWRKDRTHPTIAEAYYNEYKKSSSVWQTYPSAMISKVAEVLALKRSFSINGVVTEEEIGFEAPAEPKKTRAEGIAAAAEVGQRRIAELSAAAPVVHEAELVDSAPPAEPPSDMERQLTKSIESAWITKMMTAFGAAKETLGEAEYRAVLARFDCTNKQDVMKKGQQEAKKIFAHMAARIKEIKGRQAHIDGFADLVGNHGEKAVIQALANHGYESVHDIPGDRIEEIYNAVAGEL